MNVSYLAIRVDADSDGILKDLIEISGKAAELERLANEMKHKILLSEEPAKNADSSAG